MIPRIVVLVNNPGGGRPVAAPYLLWLGFAIRIGSKALL